MPHHGVECKVLDHGLDALLGCREMVLHRVVGCKQVKLLNGEHMAE